MAKLNFLEGMRVVDLSTFVAGPTCAKLLGEYGALNRISAIPCAMWPGSSSA